MATKARTAKARASKGKKKSRKAKRQVKPSEKRAAARVTNLQARADRNLLSLRRRGLIALKLDPLALPPTPLSDVLGSITLSHNWDFYLRHHDSEEARALIALYDDLADDEAKALPVDDFIRKLGLDWHKTFGAIAEQVSKIETAKASMMAAAAAPGLVRSMVHWGHGWDGNADRKLGLQIAGVAPVPKNQVTNITMGNNSVIDQRKQAVLIERAPTLEEVVRDVDSLVFDGADPREARPGARIPNPDEEEAADGGPRVPRDPEEGG